MTTTLETEKNHVSLEMTEVFIDQHYEQGFLAVAKMLSKHHVGLQEAKDIFHDALIILWKHQNEGRRIESGIGYLVGIARHIVQARKRNATMLVTDEIPDIADSIDKKIYQPLFQRILNQGKRCLDLLNAFYYEDKSVSEIAVEFKLSGEHSASVQKYKCIEKIRNEVKLKGLHYEDFLE